jgi:hypothetical protein
MLDFALAALVIAAIMPDYWHFDAPASRTVVEQSQSTASILAYTCFNVHRVFGDRSFVASTGENARERSSTDAYSVGAARRTPRASGQDRPSTATLERTSFGSQQSARY